MDTRRLWSKWSQEIDRIYQVSGEGIRLTVLAPKPFSVADRHDKFGTRRGNRGFTPTAEESCLNGGSLVATVVGHRELGLAPEALIHVRHLDNSWTWASLNSRSRLMCAVGPSPTEGHPSLAPKVLLLTVNRWPSHPQIFSIDSDDPLKLGFAAGMAVLLRQRFLNQSFVDPLPRHLIRWLSRHDLGLAPFGLPSVLRGPRVTKMVREYLSNPFDALDQCSEEADQLWKALPADTPVQDAPELGGGWRCRITPDADLVQVIYPKKDPDIFRGTVHLYVPRRDHPKSLVIGRNNKQLKVIRFSPPEPDADLRADSSPGV